MDKRGKGEISLEEFKDGLVERWAVLDDASLASASRPVSGCRHPPSLASFALLLRFCFCRDRTRICDNGSAQTNTLVFFLAFFTAVPTYIGVFEVLYFTVVSFYIS